MFIDTSLKYSITVYMLSLKPMCDDYIFRIIDSILNYIIKMIIFVLPSLTDQLF